MNSTPFSSHHLHDLGATVMPVAADGNPGVWPVPADATNQPTQMTTCLGARGRLAGAQQHGDRPACRRVVDVDRHETALVVMSVEQRELLMPMNDIHCIVDIEGAAGHAKRVLAQPVSKGTLIRGSERFWRNIQIPSTRA
jgi:hypothetical protein